MIGLLLYRLCGSRCRFPLERLLGIEFKPRCYHGRALSPAGCADCSRDAHHLARTDLP